MHVRHVLFQLWPLKRAAAFLQTPGPYNLSISEPKINIFINISDESKSNDAMTSIYSKKVCTWRQVGGRCFLQPNEDGNGSLCPNFTGRFSLNSKYFISEKLSFTCFFFSVSNTIGKLPKGEAPYSLIASLKASYCLQHLNISITPLWTSCWSFSPVFICSSDTCCAAFSFLCPPLNISCHWKCLYSWRFPCPTISCLSKHNFHHSTPSTSVSLPLPLCRPSRGGRVHPADLRCTACLPTVPFLAFIKGLQWACRSRRLTRDSNLQQHFSSEC